MNIKQIICALSISLFLSGCNLLSSPKTNQPEPVAPTYTPGQEISVEGTAICMPHRDSDGPQTLECAFGLQTEDEVFGITIEDGNPDEFVVNTRYRVTGRVEDSESDYYVNDWVIEVTELEALDSESAEGRFCGGIAANMPDNQCPTGYECVLDGSYPDAGGTCQKI